MLGFSIAMFDHHRVVGVSVRSYLWVTDLTNHPGLTGGSGECGAVDSNADTCDVRFFILEHAWHQPLPSGKQTERYWKWP